MNLFIFHFSPRSARTKAAAAIFVWLALACSPSLAAGKMSGDGLGCTDSEIAARTLGLDDTDPEYIAIWVNGMQDRSCRGYSAGQEVDVVERTEEMACVRAADDEACFWVNARIAPALP